MLTRGRVPVVVGGTGFYMRWLLHGIPNEARQDHELAAAIREEFKGDSSWEQSLHRLEILDPHYAKRLQKNDYYRLGRALAIVKITGRPVSDFGFGKTCLSLPSR